MTSTLSHSGGLAAHTIRTVTILLLLAPAARGETMEESQRAQARARFLDGQAALAEARFDDAAAAFEEAGRLVRSPAIHFNRADALYRAGSFRQAGEAMKACLQLELQRGTMQRDDRAGLEALIAALLLDDHEHGRRRMRQRGRP